MPRSCFFFFHAFFDGFVANTCLTFDTESLREHIAKKQSLLFRLYSIRFERRYDFYTNQAPASTSLISNTWQRNEGAFFIFPPSSATIEQRSVFWELQCKLIRTSTYHFALKLERCKKSGNTRDGIELKNIFTGLLVSFKRVLNHTRIQDTGSWSKGVLGIATSSWDSNQIHAYVEMSRDCLAN